MIVAVVLAVLLIALAIFSVIRWPFLHPLQLWSVPWAFGAGLEALHLLPYKPLSLATGLLILGATATYVGGALFMAGRTERRPLGPPDPRSRPNASLSPLEIAAALAVVMTFLGLILFLVQIGQSFGLRKALVTALQVREALGHGTASLTIKYLYIAFAAAALCGIAAGAATDRRRRLWLFLGVLTVLAQYFTTGRSNIVLAGVVLVLAEAIVRRRAPTPRRLVAATGLAAILGLLVFTIGGALVGKTLANNELETVVTPLTRDRLLRPLALPYEYASAPIATFGRLVQDGPRTSLAWGCASFSVVCQVAARAGAGVTPVPTIRPDEPAPLRWNTYTALDLPLLDGGPIFVIVFFALAGAWVGWLWRLARAGVTSAAAVYAVYGGLVVLYSSVQDNFVASHVVAAGLLVVAFLWLGTMLSGGRRGALRYALRGRFDQTHATDATDANRGGDGR